MVLKLRNCFVVGLLVFGVPGCEPESSQGDVSSVTAEASSHVSRTDANELILKQEMTVAAPVEAVWAAYTTTDGWTAWASPKAEVDLRVSGTIRTAYEGEIGGSSTNTLHIVNYVPHRLLTLRADVSSSWPEIMQEDADKLSNVILFDEVAEGITRIQSFGIGYTDAPEYDQLMNFFIKANESLYQNLKIYLETGSRVDWGQ